MRIARRIGFPPESDVVLPSIDLDDEARGETREVDDQMVDRHLTTEVEALGFEQAEMPPEFSLGVGLGSPELSRAVVCHGPPTPAPPRKGEGNFICRR
jgi:hypothetical protein